MCTTLNITVMLYRCVRTRSLALEHDWQALPEWEAWIDTKRLMADYTRTFNNILTSKTAPTQLLPEINSLVPT